MPTPKVRFQEQKSPKSGTQYNFQEHISNHIPTFMKQIRLPDFTGKSQRNLPYQFRTAENAILADHARLSACPIISQLQSSQMCHLTQQW